MARASRRWQDVQRELGAAILLIGHDMALMAHFVDDLGVMYAGRLVESGPVRRLFAAPRHPYTKMLIESLPSFERRGTFRGIPGVGPSLLSRIETATDGLALYVEELPVLADMETALDRMQAWLSQRA